MPIECKCFNCQRYDNEEEYCNFQEQYVFSNGWCMDHKMDLEKEDNPIIIGIDWGRY